MGKKVAIIGGGNVAIDVARSSLRLGSKQVDLYYRRSRKEMPAIPEEVEEATREGVKIHILTAPIRIIRRGEKAIGMECLRSVWVNPTRREGENRSRFQAPISKLMRRPLSQPLARELIRGP